MRKFETEGDNLKGKKKKQQRKVWGCEREDKNEGIVKCDKNRDRCDSLIEESLRGKGNAFTKVARV